MVGAAQSRFSRLMYLNLEMPVYMQTTQTRVFGLFMGNKAWLPDLQNAEITLKKVSSTKNGIKI